MTQIQQRIILAAFVASITVAPIQSIALAQSAAALGRHHVISLTSQTITLPFGDNVFAGEGKAAKVANSRCLLCHSKDMIGAQPPLSLDTWKREVDKMRTVYGCPLRADQAAAVADFISHAIAPAANGN